MAGRPPKPWERGLSRPSTSSLTDLAAGYTAEAGPTGLPEVPANPSGLPPVPPRTTIDPYSSSAYGYQPASYGMSMYGGYGAQGYGSYGQYGGYGAPSLLVRTAEQSSRPAFEMMEGVVQSAGAVSMMLESSYSAVFNSFRAVMGCVEQFSLLRGQLARLLSGLLAVRWISWFLRVILGRRTDSIEAAWKQAAAQSVKSARQQGSSWPVLLFFAFILGAPWLVWKLVSRAAKIGAEWMSGCTEHYLARAVYDFTGRSRDELSFRCGDMIRIAPKHLQPQIKGWLLASVNGKDSGLVPVNYIKILGKRSGTKSTTEQSELADQRTKPNTSSADVTSSKSCCSGEDSQLTSSEPTSQTPGVPASTKSCCSKSRPVTNVQSTVANGNCCSERPSVDEALVDNLPTDFTSPGDCNDDLELLG